MTNEIRNKYFEWMYDLVCSDRFSENRSFRKLLTYLYETDFTCYLRSDMDRVTDGIDLRYRFAYLHKDYPDAERYLTGPCSVLEMMVALAIRCEETIMSDPKYGDRTAQWFWKMITNLGLGSMLDDRFDMYHLESVIDLFLRREYEPDGRGGLFVLKNCDYDLRDVDIWTQMNWYINTIVY